MLATFKETWTSVRDLEYGKVIVKKTVGQAFWYWFKYVLVFCLVLMVLGIAALTYFTPQLSRLARHQLPEIGVTIADGQLITNVPQPLIAGDNGFKFILNTEGHMEDADELDSGILILKDRLVIKNGFETRIFNFSEFDDFTLAKDDVVNWLENNRSILFSLGLVITLVAGIVGISLYAAWKWVGFLIGGLAMLLLAKIIKRKITFSDSLKLILYAAVPAFLISILLGFFGSQIGPVVSFIMWVFFSIAWLSKLPSSS